MQDAMGMRTLYRKAYRRVAGQAAWRDQQHPGGCDLHAQARPRSVMGRHPSAPQTSRKAAATGCLGLAEHWPGVLCLPCAGQVGSDACFTALTRVRVTHPCPWSAWWEGDGKGRRARGGALAALHLRQVNYHQRLLTLWVTHAAVYGCPHHSHLRLLTLWDTHTHTHTQPVTAAQTQPYAAAGCQPQPGLQRTVPLGFGRARRICTHVTPPPLSEDGMQGATVGGAGTHVNGFHPHRAPAQASNICMPLSPRGAQGPPPAPVTALTGSAQVQQQRG